MRVIILLEVTRVPETVYFANCSGNGPYPVMLLGCPDVYSIRWKAGDYPDGISGTVSLGVLRTGDS